MDDINRNFKENNQNELQPKIKKPDFSAYYEIYEYLILKIYFRIPFFPLFKPSTLRKDFNFAIYLKHCLLEKLGIFYKISWTCWVILIISIFMWNILIVPSGIVFIVIYRLTTACFYAIVPFTGHLLHCAKLFLYEARLQKGCD